MCCFRHHRQKRVLGLLPTRDSFPLPLEENFGGDVLIGWKKLRLADSFMLRSNIQGTLWSESRPLAANGEPSTATGYGIYMYDKRESFGSYIGSTVIARIAGWGRALDFEERPVVAGANKPGGAMVEFAYPLDLYVAHETNARRLREIWGKYGVNIHVERQTWTRKSLCWTG